MISCAAVQKLERYGQLGLKRNSVDDYVQSSLKDSKRANLFALTHLETWRECRDYICFDDTDSSDRNESPHSQTVLISLPKKEVAVSDSLVYAMSFTTALIGEHCHRACRDLAWTSEQQKKNKAPAANVEADIFEGEAAWVTCASLVSLLKDIAATMHSQRTRVWTQHGSATLTQAVAHYCGTLVDALVALMALHSLLCASDRLQIDVQRVDGMHADMFTTLTAATRHLKRCQAHYPVESLFHTRTLPAMIRQYLHKQQQQKSTSHDAKGRASKTAAAASAAPALFSWDDLCAKLGVTREGLEAQPPLVRLLLCTALTSASSALVLDGCTLFQKLSLVYALVSLDAAGEAATLSRDGSESMAPATLSSSLLDQVPVAARAQLQSTLCALLAPQACNRATRYVVYYRGDDVRLLQNNVRQPGEYALHTFTTTAPIDPALITSLSEFFVEMQHTSVPLNVANANMRCAVLMASWMASAPFFFHSFCSDSTWSVFAREQRRMTILNQIKARREQKQERRKRKRGQDGSTTGTAHDGDEHASVRSDDASDTASVSSHHSAVSLSSVVTAGGGGGLFDTASLASRHSSIGLLSLASRASVLSTLSKRSQASYLSFLSVLKPEGGGGDGGEGSAVEAPKLHESEDGNTNLPLILLEALVLGMYSVMENYETSLMDAFGLRVLAWQCIGHMVALVQGSMHHHGYTRDGEGHGTVSEQRLLSPLVTSMPTPIFNLGYDTRYNHGMGYEVLGLLFARVISPQLEGDAPDEEGEENEAAKGETTRRGQRDSDEDEGEQDVQSTTASVAISENASPTGGRLGGGGLVRTTRGRPYVSVDKDAAPVVVRVEAALSQCLSTYEDVAPQVVDSNLAVILRIAARAASLPATMTTTQSKVESLAVKETSPHVLLTFLSDITQRLGKGNQVPVLLDALLKPDAITQATDGAAKEKEEEEVVVEDAVQNMAALQHVFAQPIVHVALTEACALSMDPETLLSHISRYVAALTEESESVNEEATSETVKTASLSASPTYVLFLLQLVAAVLEGVSPTSVTSAPLLERSTELELLLATFLVERVAPLLLEVKKDAEVAARTWHFTTEVKQTSKKTTYRALLLHALYALYQCRLVTRSCLQDLGSAPVMPYLEMLEETLWQCQTQVGVVAGTTYRVETLAAMLTDTTTAAFAPLTLRMDPHFDAPTLLTLLTVQRLSLARAVSTMLGVEVGPAGEARVMAHDLLDALAAEQETNANKMASLVAITFASPEAAVSVASWLTTEHWQSVCAFGKPKRVRQRLVSLLRHSFGVQASAASSAADADASSSSSVMAREKDAVASSATLSASAGDAPHLPVWLARCLQVDGGAVLRALVTLLFTVSSEDVTAALLVADTDATTAPALEARRLLFTVRALREIYLSCGHVPYWCSLLDTTVGWLQDFYRNVTRLRQDGSHQEVNAVLLAALLALVRDCLLLERRVTDVCRQALFEIDAVETDVNAVRTQDEDGVAHDGSKPAASPSAAHQCRVAFTAALGVPVNVTIRAGTASSADKMDEEETQEAEVDVEQQEADALLHVVASLFSPRSRFTRLLWLVSSGELGASVKDACELAGPAQLNPLRHTAVSIMAFSYTTALHAAQVWPRMHGNQTGAARQRDVSAFLGFGYARHVAAQFGQCLSGEQETHEIAKAGRSKGDAKGVKKQTLAHRLACGAVLVTFLSLLDGKALVLPVSGGGGGGGARRARTRLQDTAAEADSTPKAADNTTSAQQAMTDIFQEWLFLLHDQLCRVVCDAREPASQALSCACEWANALYGHVLHAFLTCGGGGNQTARSSLLLSEIKAPVKRKREKTEDEDSAEGVQNAEAEDAAVVVGKPGKSHATEASSQFILTLAYARDGAAASSSSAITRLTAALKNVFEGKDADTLILRLVQSDSHRATSTGESSSYTKCIPTFTTAWLFLTLYDVVIASSSATAAAAQRLQRALQVALPLNHAEAPSMLQKKEKTKAKPAEDDMAKSDAQTNSAKTHGGAHAWTRPVPALCASAPTVLRLEQELHTLAYTFRLMHANTVPSVLHHYMHGLFRDVLPRGATQRALLVWLGELPSSDENTNQTTATTVNPAARLRGYTLLSTVADVVLALSAVSGMRMASLVPVVKRLLWASTALSLPAAAPSSGSQRGHTLWGTLLQLCALPSPALTRDNSFLDATWWFVYHVLEARVVDVTAGAGAASTVRSGNASATAAPSTHVLSCEEVMLVLRLLNHTWLRAGIFWRVPALLPNLMASLFEVVVGGVQDQRFPSHTVLNALASFLFQLVKDVEMRRRQHGGSAHAESQSANGTASAAAGHSAHKVDGDAKKAKIKMEMDTRKQARREGNDGLASQAVSFSATEDVKLGQQTAEEQAGAALGMASTATQYLTLAASTAAVFEIAHAYISIFTTYSNDMDFIASDLLKALNRVHLPRKWGPPIAYHAGARIVNHGLAASTYSDLAFTAVGNDESKALLRQAALRIEDEHEDLVDEATRTWQEESGQKTRGTRGGQRSIFRVAQ